MTKKEIEAHVFGVVIVNHYNLKKGTGLFGNRAKEAVSK